MGLGTLFGKRTAKVLSKKQGGTWGAWETIPRPENFSVPFWHNEKTPRSFGRNKIACHSFYWPQAKKKGARPQVRPDSAPKKLLP